jgi:hypothetical protein
MEPHRGRGPSHCPAGPVGSGPREGGPAPREGAGPFFSVVVTSRARFPVIQWMLRLSARGAAPRACALSTAMPAVLRPRWVHAATAWLRRGAPAMPARQTRCALAHPAPTLRVAPRRARAPPPVRRRLGRGPLPGGRAGGRGCGPAGRLWKQRRVGAGGAPHVSESESLRCVQPARCRGPHRARLGPRPPAAASRGRAGGGRDASG